MEAVYRKAQRLLTITVVIYALLVASHEGEFWPLSIYPMFSQGGHSWSRSLVRDVSDLPDSLHWQEISIDKLPGHSYPLEATGINQNDIANFISKSGTWEYARILAMRKIFGDAVQQNKLMLIKVEGALNEADKVIETYTPFLILAPDTTLFNPNLTYAGVR